MLTINLTTEQKAVVALAPLTGRENPAVLDGAPVWAVVEGDAELVVAEDGMSAEILSGAANVVSRIVVTADADLDAGEVREISDEIVLVVSAPEAQSLGLSFNVVDK